MAEKQNIYQKLAKARVMIQEQNVAKSGRNAFTKFSYLELTDFLPQTNEIFESLGLIGIFDMEDGRATLTVQNSEDRDERVCFNTPVPQGFSPNGSNPAQALGSLHTYFRRYLYTNALELAVKDTIDDKDPNQPQEKKTTQYPKQEPPRATPSPAPDPKDSWQKTCDELKELITTYPKFKDSPVKIATFIQNVREDAGLTYQQKFKILKRTDEQYELDNAKKFEKNGK